MIESGKYQSIGDFHEGYAVATKVNSGGEVWSSFEGKFQQHGPSTRLYILNEHFEEVGGPYSSVEDFFEDRAIVGVMNEGYFYVDKDFKKIAGPFDSAEPFLDGRAQVAKQGKSYWIGLDGEEIAGVAKI
ncbi:WG repeat-containing protein [Candidatus Campbellbacteria bacterium]|nr:MAG: WG repeat-containing protein [Candidatus Campbellbacteria bacterium]